MARRLPESLGCESHDHAEEHAGEQDVPEKRHARAQDHQQTEHSGDRQTRENSPSHRMNFPRKESDGHSGDKALGEREGDHAGHAWSERRLEKAAEAVEESQRAAYG